MGKTKSSHDARLTQHHNFLFVLVNQTIGKTNGSLRWRVWLLFWDECTANPEAMLNPRFSSPALHVDSFWCARWKLNLIQWVGSKVHTDLLLQSWFRDSNLISWCFCILEAVKWGPLTKISPSVFLLPQNPCLRHFSTYHSLMQTSCHPALFRSWLTLKCPDL